MCVRRSYYQLYQYCEIPYKLRHTKGSDWNAMLPFFDSVIYATHIKKNHKRSKYPIPIFGGVCCRVVNTSNSGSGGPGFKHYSSR